MTGVSAPCKKASPLAAPIAIFSLVAHGIVVDTPNVIKKNQIDHIMVIAIHKKVAGPIRKIKCKEDECNIRREMLLLKRWFSRLPRGMNS